jgi:hypothetical protein
MRENRIMYHRVTPASHHLTDLSILVESLGWLRSAARRQQSQPWQPIKCGPSREAVSVHIGRFKRDWSTTIRQIASGYPSASGECAALLKVDPLDLRTDAAVAAAVARIRRMVSDPKAARSIVRGRERTAFGERVIALRREKGWSLRRLARECAETAKRRGFGVRAPDRFQLMDYETGRSNAQPRTKLVLAMTLAVAVDEIVSSPSAGL